MMSFRRVLLLLAVSLATLVNADPVAATGSRQERLLQELQRRFTLADANGDGALTAAEAIGKMPLVYSHFAAIDQDKNGLVSLEDIRNYYIASQSVNHPVMLH